MATRSFLLDTDRDEALRRLVLPGAFPAGVAEARRGFSLWLEERLLDRLHGLGDFTALRPVILGSWSRHELTPRSDIDLLFTGEEASVKEFIARAFAAGLKLRARVPEAAADWSAGVEPFDLLALQSAAALETQTAERLAGQKLKVREHRRAIFKAVRREREERRRRQDSIANYLEPNLKFGTGGLRDIEQALALRSLMAATFTDADPYPFEVLTSIKEELLFLRCALHLLGTGGDILTAPDQMELAGRLGFGSARELMTFVQSELERASFYADWVVAFAAAGREGRLDARRGFSSLNDVLARLKDKPTLLRQFEIRRTVNDWFKPLAGADVGKALHKALYGEGEDAYLVSLHRTRLLEGFLPDLKKIRGLVQHDHYHRFTADAHVVQTLREVQRAESKPRVFGKEMAALARELGPADWWTLKLTALFHDLGKGRKNDHSSEGAKLVEKYFAEWGYPAALKDDVKWLVANHLILSTAAFRQNPRAQTTWKRLFERGVEGRRLVLLALFTAIDIRATNPEAWTEWKAQLLGDLVANLRSRPALSLQAHLKLIGRLPARQAERLESWLLALDPQLLELLPPRLLLADLQACAKAVRPGGRAPSDVGAAAVAKVSRVRGRTWVRFHQPVDRPGVFLNLVRRLFGFGLSIQMSSVHTLEGIGVYDWFCLRTEKPARQIAKWLALPDSSEGRVPAVEFQSIDLMAQDEGEWIFSFRGRDQRGLLLAAAQALAEENLSLRWARAHTWGHQVDDIFSVRPLGEVDAVLERLRRRFVT
jgi:[protein-PII] uridylyltransferase